MITREQGVSVETDAEQHPFKLMEARNKALRRLFDDLLLSLRPSIVCDIGAFDGEESVRFAKLLPTSHVVAFEASERNIQAHWKDSDTINSLPQIHYEYLAVTDHTGVATLNVLDEDSSEQWRDGASSLMDRVDTRDFHHEIVPATTLDDYFGPEGVQLNTFALWIDVEGALDKVLAGATRVLERTLLLFAEVEHRELWRGQRLATHLMSMVEAAGFARLGDTYIPGAYDQSDVLCVRRDLTDLLPLVGRDR